MFDEMERTDAGRYRHYPHNLRNGDDFSDKSSSEGEFPEEDERENRKHKTILNNVY